MKQPRKQVPIDWAGTWEITMNLRKFWRKCAEVLDLVMLPVSRKALLHPGVEYPAKWWKMKMELGRWNRDAWLCFEQLNKDRGSQRDRLSEALPHMSTVQACTQSMLIAGKQVDPCQIHCRNKNRPWSALEEDKHSRHFASCIRADSPYYITKSVFIISSENSQGILLPPNLQRP